jgi:hypothetical protein
VLPELVAKEDLPSASALNGIEFNFARAVGLGLAGAVIAIWGVGRAFLLNAFSFVAVIVVVARWKRPQRERTVPVETLSAATIAALRFVRFAPAVRAVILRSGVVMFFASGLLALLPSIARTARNSPFGYGFLLGGFGLGAVLGAVAMQSMRKRLWAGAGTLATVGLGVFVLVPGHRRRYHSMEQLAKYQPSRPVRRPTWRTSARCSSLWNTTSPRNEPPISSMRCSDTDSASDHRTTYNTAHTYHQAAKDCSISSAQCRRLCVTKTGSLSQRAITSSHMAASLGWEGPPPGSPPTLSASRRSSQRALGRFTG